MIQVLLVAGMALVVLALLGCWVGEVCGLNDRLDAADKEDRDRARVTSGYRTTALPPDHMRSDHWPDRIDQRRD